MSNQSPLGPEAQFQAYLADGHFMLQRSRSTGKYVFYPRIAVPGSGEVDLEWVETAGYGTIYAITVNRTREGHWNIALVDLDEGVRMMSRIIGVETAAIGARVKARIESIDGKASVVFELSPERAT